MQAKPPNHPAHGRPAVALALIPLVDHHGFNEAHSRDRRVHDEPDHVVVAERSAVVDCERNEGGIDFSFCQRFHVWGYRPSLRRLQLQ